MNIYFSNSEYGLHFTNEYSLGVIFSMRFSETWMSKNLIDAILSYLYH